MTLLRILFAYAAGMGQTTMISLLGVIRSPLMLLGHTERHNTSQSDEKPTTPCAQFAHKGSFKTRANRHEQNNKMLASILNPYA
jgi:hypothetical protein